MTGDGGFNAHIGGLRTLQLLKNKNIIIIVLDNSKNGLIEIYQRKGHQGEANMEAVEHGVADFVGIAAAYGIESIGVNSIKEFEQELHRAFKLSEPMLIRVPVYYPTEHLERLIKTKKLG